MSSRSILRTSSILRSTLRQQTSAFSTTQHSCAAKDQGPNKTHMTDKKGGNYDVQSENSKAAHNDRASGAGSSQATSEKSSAVNGNEQAKKDHPEAPDTVIGMNDERGGKGH